MEIALRTSLQKVLQKIDQKLLEIQKQTGLVCPFGCGSCCNNPNIEVSPLDWIFQAEIILETGTLEATLRKLEGQEKHSVCIYYNSDPGYRGSGRCLVYENRPVVCRLFGFSAVRDKNGLKKASICKIHKEALPNESRKFALLAERTDFVPVFSEIYTEFLGIKPNWGEQMPINLALKKALEILVLDYRNPTPLEVGAIGDSFRESACVSGVN